MPWTIANNNQLNNYFEEDTSHGSETELDYGIYVDEGIVRSIEFMPAYTTDLNAAWHVAEQFGNVELSMYIPGKYRCSLSKYSLTAKAEEETPALAICIAALTLKGYWIKP